MFAIMTLVTPISFMKLTVKVSVRPYPPTQRMIGLLPCCQFAFLSVPD